MNTSVSPLPREEEVNSRIHRIREFSRKARSLCAVLFAFYLIVILFVTFVVLRTPFTAPAGGTIGMFGLLISPFTPLPLKVWSLLVIAVGVGFVFPILLQLHRLFGNLAAGSIHTSENVRRVRRVGRLCLLASVLSIVLPATLVIVNAMLAAPVELDLDRVFPSLGDLLTSFAAAGLVLLVSWILDVGVYEKQHAEALRRDADLVI